jgi:hypothetical protein
VPASILRSRALALITTLQPIRARATTSHLGMHSSSTTILASCRRPPRRRRCCRSQIRLRRVACPKPGYAPQSSSESTRSCAGIQLSAGSYSSAWRISCASASRPSFLYAAASPRQEVRASVQMLASVYQADPVRHWHRLDTARVHRGHSDWQPIDSRIRRPAAASCAHCSAKLGRARRARAFAAAAARQGTPRNYERDRVQRGTGRARAARSRAPRSACTGANSDGH